LVIKKNLTKKEGQKKIFELGITGFIFLIYQGPEGHALSRPSIVEAEAVHRGI
jgi:hypothetical protein